MLEQDGLLQRQCIRDSVYAETVISQRNFDPFTMEGKKIFKG